MPLPDVSGPGASTHSKTLIMTVTRLFRDTRDVEKRQRFLPWRPEQHFRGDLTKSFIMDPLDHRGFSIFHENLVAMHHLSAEEIRLIHGMLYGVAPHLLDLKKKQRRKGQITNKRRVYFVCRRNPSSVVLGVSWSAPVELIWRVPPGVITGLAGTRTNFFSIFLSV